MSSSIQDFSLVGKIALVTGGGQGLGRGVARALAQAGAGVVVASRTQVQVEEVAAEIRGLGRRALAVVADVRRMEDETTSEFGRLDVLVNAAGVNQRTPSLEVTSELWDRSWA